MMKKRWKIGFRFIFFVRMTVWFVGENGVICYMILHIMLICFAPENYDDRIMFSFVLWNGNGKMQLETYYSKNVFFFLSIGCNH